MASCRTAATAPRRSRPRRRWKWSTTSRHHSVSDPRRPTFAIDDHVHWTWGRGEGHGRIAARFDERVERVIKGSRIVRKGSSANPAYLIEMIDGREVLKLGSEISGD